MSTIFTSKKKQEFLNEIDKRVYSLTEPEIGCDTESTFEYKGEVLKFRWKKYRVECIDSTETECFVIWKKKITVDQKFIEKYEEYCNCRLCTFTPQTLMDDFRSYFPLDCSTCAGCISSYLDNGENISNIPSDEIVDLIDAKLKNRDNHNAKKLREKAVMRVNYFIAFVILFLLFLLFN